MDIQQTIDAIKRLPKDVYSIALRSSFINKDLIALADTYEQKEAEIARLRAALDVAILTIDGLAEQQATPDDWYLTRLQTIGEALKQTTEEK